ncbi:MAG: radical SAM protein [Gammaproteobacteria bacterium]|nr:radical SAM protein [Gammaproteobacteria bacterium]
MNALRVLVVDLNNFSRYPTIAVGYLAAVLRAQDIHVTVLSPLAYGVPGVAREPAETAYRDAGRRLNYALAYAPGRAAQYVRQGISIVRGTLATRTHPHISRIFSDANPADFDLVLVSTYLMYYDVCAEIGRRCEKAGVPLVIGGSYFAIREVAQAWLDIPGLHALVGGEIELELPDIVRRAVSGGELSGFAGIWLPNGCGTPRPPLKALDAVPFPDYSDFPWSAYPNRIIPMITGRGCGWGVCTFCSDVTSTAGRTFRSRSSGNVLNEIEHQSRKHGTSLFVFTDLKLNSDLEVWQTLASSMAQKSRSPSWIGSVHVGAQAPNGLDVATLKQARQSGLVRLTTGLESGSQRILDKWVKGTDLAISSRFFHDAAAAGISLRVTMIHGAPAEEARDVRESAEFLERHSDVIDRVNLNRFQIMIGPSFLRRYDSRPGRFPSIRAVKRNPRLAIADHEHTMSRSFAYFRATQRLLSAVHRINRKRLPGAANQFEGVM